MSLKKEVIEAYRNHINAHLSENCEGAASMKKLLEHSPLNLNGVLEKTVHIPKVFSTEDVESFENIAKTTYEIFGKVINEYLNCEDYRKLFPFSEELEQLIMLPARYEGFLPITRFDIFYNEDTGSFQFCEINTDGTAAMLRDAEMRKALICNRPPVQPLRLGCNSKRTLWKRIHLPAVLCPAYDT